MYRRNSVAGLLFVMPVLFLQIAISSSPGMAQQNKAVLWSNPGNISSRDLFYGSGGKENLPRGPYVFLEEDLSGTSPKFDVRDANGFKWQVKLGPEARPETAASRLLWAVGYATIDYYYLPEIHVANMPPRLHRGQYLVASDGLIHGVRLKRHPGEKKVGLWHWRKNPFAGTREYNGLRVMMALFNNWDLKDVNNSIYRKEDSNGLQGNVDFYMVTDLGASFGAPGLGWRAAKSRGNLNSYIHSPFIRRVTSTEVDFAIPSRASLFNIFDLPAFMRRLCLRWIGKHIPLADAKWAGTLLAALSPDQIRDAFRAAGFTSSEVEGFTQTVLKRVAELNGL
jgi:hypothetical protein